MTSLEGTKSDRSILKLNHEFVFAQSDLTKDMLRKVPRGDHPCSYICCVCSRGFGNDISARHHVSSKSHIARAKEQRLKDVLPAVSHPMSQHLSALTSFLEYSYMQQSALGQLVARESIALELQKLIEENYTGVSVNLHGSSASGYALVDSNVNLSLGIPSKLEIPDIMIAVLRRLKQCGDVYEMVLENFFSYNKIPRILFKHKCSGLFCEVRANAENPIVLAQLLKVYGSLDDRALKLGVLFKHWAKVCGVDAQEAGHYPSHMFILMTIHYLQQRDPPVLPVLHEHHPDLFTPTEVPKEENELFYNDAVARLSFDWSSSNDESLGTLWYELFRYYALDFKMNTHAVSIRQSAPLLREDRQWGAARLAVEDPLIPRSNIARTASSDKVFTYLRLCLQMSFVYFSSTDQSVVTAGGHLAMKYCEGNCGDSLGSGIMFPLDPVFSGAVKTSFSFLHESVLHAEEKVHVPTIISPADKYKMRPQLDVEFGDFADSLQYEDPCDKTILQSHCDGMSASLKLHQVKKRGLLQNFSFCRENFIVHHYPIACMNCKRQGHKSSNCPTDILPVHLLEPLKRTYPSRRSLLAVDNVFMKYLQSVISTDFHLQQRKEICDSILHDMKLETPGASLHLFGSSANGFGSYKSDLDMCLIIPSDAKVEKKDKVEIIKTIASELGKQPRKYADISTVTTARVPIVNFKVNLHGRRLECDISLGNYLALHNTRMLAAYSNIDERVKPLGYALKYFAKLCDMGDASKGSLSSYAYILILIHYLQRLRPPVLPVLQELRHKGGEEFIIDGWNCYYFAFDSPHDLRKVWPHYRTNRQSIGELWIGFLWFILRFNWDKEVVTIRQHKPLSKVEKWWTSKVMCIEDPFDLSHNLASAVTGKMRSYIYERFLFALTYHSQNHLWYSFESMMDKNRLVGKCRAPNFMICSNCGHRGHKARECPDMKCKPVEHI